MKYANCAALLICFAVPALAGELPNGWHLSGSAPEDYVACLDRATVHGGSASALLASQSAIPDGFGTLMQESVPGVFLGKRVRMTAQVRVHDVEGWSGLWLRVDGGTGEPPLAFDNMANRPIKGNSDWKEYAIVLNVPPQASGLAYGILLQGAGQVWLDDVKFEVVADDALTTPRNLDFEN